MNNRTTSKNKWLILAYTGLFLTVFLFGGVKIALANTSDITDTFSDYEIGEISGQGRWTNDKDIMPGTSTSPWFRVDEHPNGFFENGLGLEMNMAGSTGAPYLYKLPEKIDAQSGWLCFNIYVEDPDFLSSVIITATYNTENSTTSQDYQLPTHYGSTGGLGGINFRCDSDETWSIKVPNYETGEVIILEENISKTVDKDICLYYHKPIQPTDVYAGDKQVKTIIDIDVYIDGELKTSVSNINNLTDDFNLYYIDGLAIMSQARDQIVWLDNLYFDKTDTPDIDTIGDWEDSFDNWDSINAVLIKDKTDCINNGYCWLAPEEDDAFFINMPEYESLGRCVECAEEYCSGTSTEWGLCPACITENACASTTKCQWLEAWTWDNLTNTSSTEYRCLPSWFNECIANDDLGTCSACSKTECQSVPTKCGWSTTTNSCYILGEFLLDEWFYTDGQGNYFIRQDVPQWVEDEAKRLGLIEVAGDTGEMGWFEESVKLIANSIMSKFPFNWISDIKEIIDTQRESHEDIEYPQLMVNVGYAGSSGNEVNLFPIEDIMTSENLADSGQSMTDTMSSFRDILSYAIWIMFAFTMFGEAKHLLAKLGITHETTEMTKIEGFK